MREPIAIDLYNQSVTGGVSKTLNSIKSDSDHVPCVICFRDDITIKVDEGGGSVHGQRKRLQGSAMRSICGKG